MRKQALLGAALLLGAAVPVVGSVPACAGEGARAALVVDAGDDGGTYRYCVALPDDSVSGIELIELAGEQHGLQYRLGSGGQAVCNLAGVGAEGDDCFGEYPDFWGYWRGDGSGGWDWSSVGGRSTLVEDGDVEAWSWGRGQDGASHPQPPPTEFNEVCEPLAAPKDENKEPRAGDPKVRAERGTTTGSTANEEQLGGRAPGERKAGRRAEEPPQKSYDAQRRMTPRTATESDDTTAAEATSETEQDDGPPATGLVALALAALLGGGGAVAMRRRRS